jgi:hypothetical protein
MRFRVSSASLGVLFRHVLGLCFGSIWIDYWVPPDSQKAFPSPSAGASVIRVRLFLACIQVQCSELWSYGESKLAPIEPPEGKVHAVGCCSCCSYSMCLVACSFRMICIRFAAVHVLLHAAIFRWCACHREETAAVADARQCSPYCGCYSCC